MSTVSIEPMVDSTGIADDGEALRRRFDEDGYLLIRGLLDPELLAGLRNDIARVLVDLGWSDEADPAALLAKGFPYREGDPAFDEAMRHLGRLERFHAFSHQPRVMSLMRRVLGDSAWPHPLGIVRVTFPQNPEATTPPHQDYPNNQGTPNLTACWMPLVDCPIELGPVAILPGSHRSGVLPLEFHLGPGGRAAVLTPELRARPWVSTDFTAGDVLIFPAMTVHRALVNGTPDRMRLSCDFRYQLEGEALTQSCLEPHLGGLTWPEIYSGWRSTELQYYWRDKQYEVVPWNDSYHSLPDEVFVENYVEVVRYEAERERRYNSRRAEEPSR